jgi:hypothetical protein
MRTVGDSAVLQAGSKTALPKGLNGEASQQNPLRRARNASVKIRDMKQKINKKITKLAGLMNVDMILWI